MKKNSPEDQFESKAFGYLNLPNYHKCLKTVTQIDQEKLIQRNNEAVSQ